MVVFPITSRNLLPIALEIEDLSDKDALFYFKDGLKDWARTELDRHDVQTLDDSIAAAESLVDYLSKNKRPNPGKSGEDKGGQRKGYARKETNQKISGGSFKQEKTFLPKRDASEPPKPCFIYEGLHWTRDCPNRKAMNALITEMREKQEKESQAEMGSLQHLSELSKLFPPSNDEEKGLMYADIAIEGKATMAMLDTGATHNFIDAEKAKRMGLKNKPSCGTIKAVNSRAKPIMGVSKVVKVRIGDWQGELSFIVVPMDDFKVVLGLEFFSKVYAFSIPRVNSLVIFDTKAVRVIPLKRMEKAIPMLSALQFKRGLKNAEGYIASLRELSDGENPAGPKEPLPKCIQKVATPYKSP